MIQKIKDKEYLYFKGEEEPIAYQSKMMQAVDWLLPFNWLTAQTLQYRRETEKSLQSWLEKEPGQEDMAALIEALSLVQKDVEQYLMDWDKLIWDAEWVCWNLQEKSLKLVYCPWDRPKTASVNFLAKLAQLFWIKAVHQGWKNRELILMIFDLNVAAVQNKIPGWAKRIDQKATEGVKVNKAENQKNALAILTEEEQEIKKKSLWQLCREKFPFALR